jgi:hypothetical protein
MLLLLQLKYNYVHSKTIFNLVGIDCVYDAVCSPIIICKVSWPRNADEFILEAVINSIVFQPLAVNVDEGVEVAAHVTLVLYNH